MTNGRETNHDGQSGPGRPEHDPPEHDPRLGEPEGEEGMPASLLDTDRNLPGDQPVDQRGPTKSDLEGTS